MLQRIWTISNLLSLSRIVLLAPIAFLLYSELPDRQIWLAVVILVATLTDFLDGFIARKLHQVTEFGKIIDPLADKIAVAGAAILFVTVGALPLWYLIVVVVRDALILAGGIYIKAKKNIVPQSSWPGKIAVTLVALVLLLTVFRGEVVDKVREWVIWLSLVAMAVSFALYAQRLFIGSRSEKRSGV